MSRKTSAYVMVMLAAFVALVVVTGDLMHAIFLISFALVALGIFLWLHHFLGKDK